MIVGATPSGLQHAGTARRDDGAVVSSGGRVLSVVGYRFRSLPSFHFTERFGDSAAGKPLSKRYRSRPPRVGSALTPRLSAGDPQSVTKLRTPESAVVSREIHRRWATAADCMSPENANQRCLSTNQFRSESGQSRISPGERRRILEFAASGRTDLDRPLLTAHRRQMPNPALGGRGAISRFESGYPASESPKPFGKCPARRHGEIGTSTNNRQHAPARRDNRTVVATGRSGIRGPIRRRPRSHLRTLGRPGVILTRRRRPSPHIHRANTQFAEFAETSRRGR